MTTHSSFLAWRIPWTWSLGVQSISVQSLICVWVLWPHGLQHTRPPCPSPTPRACSNSCPLSRWCHPTISSSIIPFPFCLQSFPASGSFPMSRLFASGGQRTGRINRVKWQYKVYSIGKYRAPWPGQAGAAGRLPSLTERIHPCAVNMHCLTQFYPFKKKNFQGLAQWSSG